MTKVEFKKGDNIKFILNYLAKYPGSTRVQVLSAHQEWRGKEKGWMATEYFKPALTPGHYYYTFYSSWKKNPESWCMDPKIEFGESNQNFLRMGWGGYTTEGFKKYFVNAEKKCYVDKFWTKVGKGWHLTPAGQEKLNKIGMIQL